MVSQPDFCMFTQLHLTNAKYEQLGHELTLDRNLEQNKKQKRFQEIGFYFF